MGYLAGIPTYSLAAELAVNRVLAGALPAVGSFPVELAATAPPRWRFSAQFSLEHARMRARRGDVTGTLGHLGRATTEAAHAVMCSRHEWVLNEKGLIDRAGLAPVHQHLARLDRGGLSNCVDEVGALLPLS